MSGKKPICEECKSDNVLLDDVSVEWNLGGQYWQIASHETAVDCLECDHKGEPDWIDR